MTSAWAESRISLHSHRFPALDSDHNARITSPTVILSVGREGKEIEVWTPVELPVLVPLRCEWIQEGMSARL